VRKALFPLRKAAYFARRLRARFDPVSKLPALFREAHDLARAGHHAAADERFTHILELDPTNAPTRALRGLSRHRLGSHADAATDALVALSSPAVTVAARAEANDLLALAHLRLGDPARAVGHRHVAELLRRYGPDAPWRQDELAEEPDEFEALAAAHNDLAEIALNEHADFAAAEDMYRRRDAVWAHYREWLAAVPQRTLYLADEWVRNIGHTAMLDFWVKMRHLGWQSWDRAVVVAPPGGIATPALARYFRGMVKVVTELPVGASRHLGETLGTRVSSSLVLPGCGRKYFLEGMGAVQEAWERAGRGPLLRLTPADDAFGRATLREMGVPDGAWFVALHVRSPGFYREAGQPHQVHRNADAANYLAAAREVVRRGGWMVRLGDPSMPPLPPAPGVIDYALGPHKSDRMDVFLLAACRFFVGGASGPTHVPTTFGVPCLVTNWISNALPVYGGHDLFVPKLIRGPQGILPFGEWLAPANRARYLRASLMAEAGLVAVENTPDELAEAVTEMLDRLDGRCESTPADEARQAAFDATARRNGLVGFSRIGRGFLRRHEHLLGEFAQARAAG
jgi:putative glycosyltransferase (TIGR04372 family)